MRVGVGTNSIYGNKTLSILFVWMELNTRKEEAKSALHFRED